MPPPSITNFFEEIRLFELKQICELLDSMGHGGGRIIDVGAGAGWQARGLADRGYQVYAIDIYSSNHRDARVWSVINFDGRKIPFPDAYFDVVYSSNVLEHVQDLKTLNCEIKRVLRPGGTVIHYVPTGSWRVWSLLAFYPSLAREGWYRLVLKKLKALRNEMPQTPLRSIDVQTRKGHKISFGKIWWRLFPHAHGAEGSCWSEILRFTRDRWDNYFSAAGWTIISYRTNGIFLTGEMLLGSLLPTVSRINMSKYLGSTAHLYVLKRR